MIITKSVYFSCLKENYLYNIHQNIHDINILMSQFKTKFKTMQPTFITGSTTFKLIKFSPTLLMKINYSFFGYLPNCFLPSVYENYFSSEVLIFYFYSF